MAPFLELDCSFAGQHSIHILHGLAWSLWRCLGGLLDHERLHKFPRLLRCDDCLSTPFALVSSSRAQWCVSFRQIIRWLVCKITQFFELLLSQEFHKFLQPRFSNGENSCGFNSPIGHRVTLHVLLQMLLTDFAQYPSHLQTTIEPPC
jgi:hypothetical protein